MVFPPQGEVLSVAYYITLGRAKLACSILVGPTCGHSYDPWNQTVWTVDIPGNKPPVVPIPDPKVSIKPVQHINASSLSMDHVLHEVSSL